MLLLRKDFGTHTLGKLIYPDDSYTYCLERPWLDNKPFYSCVPVGTYLVDRDKTGKHQWYKIREGQIEGRSFIEIHDKVITVDHLEGCLAPCMDFINGKTYKGTEACEKLLEWFGDCSFWLEIRDYNSETDGEW